jgi:6-phosphogluconolactonase/glucosamine-6-phosphate isomerase/deaminase
MTGSGRIALLKRVAEDEEITWSDYKKFAVDSRVVPREP